jgi:hypothetical protein
MRSSVSRENAEQEGARGVRFHTEGEVRGESVFEGDKRRGSNAAATALVPPERQRGSWAGRGTTCHAREAGRQTHTRTRVDPTPRRAKRKSRRGARRPEGKITSLK